MNDKAFNKELKKIAPDLELMYNPERKVWGVYQLKSKNFLMTGPTKPWVLFDIVDAENNFRLPDHTDLGRAFASVSSGHVMWEKGSDWYMDKIEAQEKAREDVFNDKQWKMAKEVAHEVRERNKVIPSRSSRA